MSAVPSRWHGRTLAPGNPNRLGAHAVDGGVQFSVWAERADKVELCLFDEATFQETARLALPGLDDGIWHGFLEGAEAGLVYGYRVHGRRDPGSGRVPNPTKVLLDPWAREVARLPVWDNALQDADPRDSALYASLGRVVAPLPPLEEPRPRTPRGRTILYEAHAKGLTQLHPKIPEELRGTWAGLAHPAVLNHLRNLGVTAVELLPVQAHADDRFLTEKGLVNYWGYSTLAYFAPHPAWASRPGQEVSEFRALVGAYHRAGIEVILDVVYNHTCEGNQDGPHLSWRGFGAWYRMNEDDSGHYQDFTGCGNSLDMRRPIALRLVIESLRYWATEMGVDGFRFDLASVLGRTDPDFDPTAPFFQALAKDPLLSRVKLIAEPWDASWEGYRLGAYPRGWSEWNDRFRDGMRRFWRGESGQNAEFVHRMDGSPDIFPLKGPKASINFVACHDGFTLRDLLSYGTKHNEDNLEGNRDGADHNESWNNGAEGESDDPAVRQQRVLLTRALLGTVLLSRGIPMLLGGDELGRTQRGNNNAYCQDNELTWVDWSGSEDDPTLPVFVRRLSAFRREHLNIEMPVRGFRSDGVSGTSDGAIGLSWGDGAIGLFNPCDHAVSFHLPAALRARFWAFELSSAAPDLAASPEPVTDFDVAARSFALLRAR